MIPTRDGWVRALANPSENLKHYYNVLIAVVFFVVAQLLICAWDQPFWSGEVDFPGQIIAMVFVWLTLCGVQLLLYESGQGLDKFYHTYLRSPVSSSLFFLTTFLFPGR
jgi:hypothetical protein